MLTVIWSDIAAVNKDTACCMPARKLAGAAMAAASNKRLMMMPPDVTATVELGLFCPLVDPPPSPSHGARLAKMASPDVLKSLSSEVYGCSVSNLECIA